MPLRLRSTKQWKEFNLPVSYRIADDRDRLSDAKNVVTVQNKLETRPGYSRFNSTGLGNQALSLTFYKSPSDTRELIAKVTSSLKVVNTTGAATDIKTGLGTSTKHRAVTMTRGTRGRHIISVDTDGLFAYDTDANIFSQLGQAVPTAPTVAKDEGGGSLSNKTWEVAYTFYSSQLGFETNIGAASSQVTTDGGNDAITVTNIASTAANGFIDKVRLYVKNVTDASDWIFWAELDLGTTTDSVDEDPTSSQTPPTTHGEPPTTGKYLTEFEGKLVVSGINADKGAVYFSEADLPDAFDDTDSQLRIYPPGGGPITGIATGSFDDAGLFAYLVIFKYSTTYMYTTNNGLIPLSLEDGCVSDKTICVINGNIYFLSRSGWKVIRRGRMITSDKGKTISLGEGDLDDIFKTEGFTYSLNKANFPNFYSIYYSDYGQIINFVSEGSSNSFNRTYNYEFAIGGFRPYQFNINFTAAVVGEDSNGEEEVYLSDTQGFIYKHSYREDRTDVDINNSDINIDVFVLTNWIFPGDMDASYNYGPLIVDALASDNDITVKTWIDSNLQLLQENDYSFPSATSGFVLDVSRLDQDILSDPTREFVRARGRVHRKGYNILIGFYQNASNSNIGLLKAQLDVSKNGRLLV